MAGMHRPHAGFEDKQMGGIRECVLSQPPREKELQRPLLWRGLEAFLSASHRQGIVGSCKTTLW